MALQIRGNSQIINGSIENDQINADASISLSKLSLSDSSTFSGDLTFSGSNVLSGSLDVSSGTLTLADDQISGDKVEGGTIASITISSIDLNGGSIDGTVIGADSAAAGSFTTLETSGDLTVGGNLTVNGTTTSINSTTLDVDDLNITVAKGAGSSLDADGAGLTIDIGAGSENPQLTWDGSSQKFNFNKQVVMDAALHVDSHVSTKGGNLTINDSSNSVMFQVVASSGDVTSSGDIQASAFTDGTASLYAGHLIGLNSVTSSEFQNASSDATFSVSSGGAVSATSISVGSVQFSSALTDGTISIVSFVDEDNMSSNSAFMLPTQQSVKAYVDSKTSSSSLDLSALPASDLSDVVYGGALAKKDFLKVNAEGKLENVYEVIQYIDVDMGVGTGDSQAVSLSVAHDDDYKEEAMVFLNGMKLRYSSDSLSSNDFHFSGASEITFAADTLASGDKLEIRYIVAS